MSEAWEKGLPDSFFHDKWRDSHIMAARSPLTWMVSGYRLKRAADIIFEISETGRKQFAESLRAYDRRAKETGIRNQSRTLSIDEHNLMIDWELINVYFMLAGLSIENFAKGVIIARDPTRVDKTGNIRLKTHNLVELVKSCKIPLSSRDEEILQVLTEYVVWRGRYFVRTGPTFPKRETDGTFEKRSQITQRDHDSVESLVERVYELLGEVMENEREKGKVG